MADKDSPVATVAIGPMLGRTITIEHYLESLQAVLDTLAIEVRAHCEKEQDDFMLRLLDLSQHPLKSAMKELGVLKDRLVVAERKQLEGGGR
jgi:hypothetical protein